MRALITGAHGQLGHALTSVEPRDVRSTALDKAALDITSRDAVDRALDFVCPQIVLNAAAYTSVDEAESQPDRAFALNATAVGNLADACAKRGIRLVHISTDYVFDGTSNRPYRPDDTPKPCNVYGASKLEGERRIAATPGLDWRVLRTQWVYSSVGRNFLLTMLRLFREQDTVRVVTDQIGTPTSALSLAACAWRTALTDGASGILHFADAGIASWYDFAVAIMEEARARSLLGRSVAIMPTATDDFPTSARRPAFSVLDTQATRLKLNLQAVHWRENLRAVLAELPR